MIARSTTAFTRPRLKDPAAPNQLLRTAGAHAPWPLVVALGSGLIVAWALVRPTTYDLPTLRAAVETAITWLALTGAWLLRVRFIHTARLRDLLQMAGLLVLALFELCCSAVPSALGLRVGGQFGGTRVLGDLLVAAVFAAAAFTPSDRIVTNRDRPVAFAAALSLVAIGACGLVGLLLRGKLGFAAGHPVLGFASATSRPVTCALIVVTAMLLASAAVACACGRFSRSEASTLVASGLVLLVAAKLFYFAVPSVSPRWISLREGLVLAAVALLLVAAVRQELQDRARTARAAAIVERLRVAQDLHDGIVQDLAFIAAHGARMAQELGGEHPVTVAAKRALSVSRGKISELSDMSSSSPGDALEAIAQELRDRFAITITVNADPHANLPGDAQEHVTRIAREAIANAARHGGADNVTVSLRPNTDGVSLCVRDDGCGIPRMSDEGTPEGFGLRNMRERATALGGHLNVAPRKGGGTELEVMLP
jgi:signal transduction histidine kinase